jgi:hypothetical protein
MRIVLLALGMALLPMGAAAQDADAQVRAYLEHGMAPHAALGYAADADIADLVTPLRLDHPILWTINLRAGATYRVYAACDNNCSDLDMELYGADGQLADRDVGRDDTPYVQIMPTRGGRYNVRIWLYSCRASACTVGARVVSGGRAAAREQTSEPASIAASKSLQQ